MQVHSNPWFPNSFFLIFDFWFFNASRVLLIVSIKFTVCYVVSLQQFLLKKKFQLCRQNSQFRVYMLKCLNCGSFFFYVQQKKRGLFRLICSRFMEKRKKRKSSNDWFHLNLQVVWNFQFLNIFFFRIYTINSNLL